MKKFICLVVCLILLTGCSVKVQYDMGINEDKSVSFVLNAGFDDELLNAMITMDEDFSSTEANEYSDEDHWNFLENSLTESEEDNPLEHGFTRTRYESDGFKGFTVSKTIDSIDSITGDDADFNLTEDFIDISESQLFQKEGNAYVSKIRFSESEDTSEYGQYNMGATAEFVVTLPNKPISHNATSVSEDGKTLTWDLTGVETGTIDFKFEFPTFPYVLLIIGVLAAIGVIAGIIIIVSLTKKKNKPVNTNISNDGLNANMSFSPEQNVSNVPPVDNQQVNNNFTNMNVVNNVAQPIFNEQPVASSVAPFQSAVETPVSEPVNNVQPEPGFSFDNFVVPTAENVSTPVTSEPVVPTPQVFSEPIQPVVQPVVTPAVPTPPVSAPVAPEPPVPAPVAVTSNNVSQMVPEPVQQNQSVNTPVEPVPNETVAVEKTVNILE